MKRKPDPTQQLTPNRGGDLVEGDMSVRERGGSKMTMSASLPTCRLPLRGYRPKSRAALVDTSCTMRRTEMRWASSPSEYSMGSINVRFSTPGRNLRIESDGSSLAASD